MCCGLNVKIFMWRKCLGGSDNSLQGEELALSRPATSRTSVVNTKSVGTVLSPWGWWDWPTVKRGTFATPCHPHTSSSVLNLITWSVKDCCLPCTLAYNSMCRVPSTELCKPREDVLCSQSCLTKPPLSRCSLAMIFFAVETWCLSCMQKVDT